MLAIFMKGRVTGHVRGGVYVNAYMRRDHFVSWAAKVLQFLQEALRKSDFKGQCEFSFASEKESKAVEAYGCPSIKGVPHLLLADSLRHAIRRHSDPMVERGMGQRAITSQDLNILPLVVHSFDKLSAEQRTDKNGAFWSLQYQKRIGQDVLYYVARYYPQSKRNSPKLVMRTAWVKVIGAPAGVEPNPTPVSTRERKETLPPAGEELKKAAAPTPAQMKAGNYKKPRVRWQGLELAIENPVGSTRSGEGAQGPWAITMKHAYGYIRRTEGADGDHVDCFVGPDLDARYVYVVHARNGGQSFVTYDEDKCMIGFGSKQEAIDAFLTNYTDPRFLGEVTVMPVADFVRKVKGTFGAPERDRKVTA